MNRVIDIKGSSFFCETKFGFTNVTTYKEEILHHFLTGHNGMSRNDVESSVKSCVNVARRIWLEKDSKVDLIAHDKDYFVIMEMLMSLSYDIDEYGYYINPEYNTRMYATEREQWRAEKILKKGGTIRISVRDYRDVDDEIDIIIPPV